MISRAWFCATVVLCSATATSSCGSDPVCGNGVKEGSEQCDNGKQNGTAGNGCSVDCKLVAIPVASLQVSYLLLDKEAPLFTGSSCFDLKVQSAHVVVAGPDSRDEMWDCGSKKSFLYSKITPGMYQATITLLDATGAALTKPVTTPMVAVQIGSTASDLMINFRQSDFDATNAIVKAYNGTLAFDPNWGMTGAGCMQTPQPVATESARLTRLDGSVVMMSTVDGTKLDGTPGPCFMKTGSAAYQSIDKLPWGHYNLTLTGSLMSGQPAYCGKYDVFVGPGDATPTYELVVAAAAAASADGGASVDGGTCP